MARTAGSVTTGDRSARQLTPRRTTNLTLKGGKDSSMLLTRSVTEDVYATAPQRLISANLRQLSHDYRNSLGRSSWKYEISYR